MEKERFERQNRYRCLSAVVDVGCTEGICPDLLRVLELDSHESTLAACRSPTHLGCIASERETSPIFSPADSEVDSPDGVFKTSKIASKFGFFSAIKSSSRRSSAPISQSPSCYKSDLLPIPEDGGGQKVAIKAHAPVRIVVSSSGLEDIGSSNKLQKKREFGSTGDLLEGSTTDFKSCLRKFLGKSMEHVSGVSTCTV